jgi:hypothetical protein
MTVRRLKWRLVSGDARILSKGQNKVLWQGEENLLANLHLSRLRQLLLVAHEHDRSLLFFQEILLILLRQYLAYFLLFTF